MNEIDERGQDAMPEETSLTDCPEMKSLFAEAVQRAVPEVTGGEQPPSFSAVSPEENGPVTTPRCRVLDWTELDHFRPGTREFILDPILRVKDMVMVYGWREIGKTYFLLALAIAVAAGRPFISWGCSRPRKVVYVDGELAYSDMRTRIELLAHGVARTRGYFHLISADSQDATIPSLATQSGQAFVEAQMGDAELVIFDNLSTLFYGVDENDAKSWDPIQTWLFTLRRQGKTIIFAHHGSKNYKQRGTSKREDAVEAVIALTKPDGYKDTEKARCILTFEKARSLHGDGRAQLDISLLEQEGGGSGWVITETNDIKMAKLIKDGLSDAEIAAILHCDRTTVWRFRKKNP